MTAQALRPQPVTLFGAVSAVPGLRIQGRASPSTGPVRDDSLKSYLHVLRSFRETEMQNALARIKYGSPISSGIRVHFVLPPLWGARLITWIRARDVFTTAPWPLRCACYRRLFCLHDGTTTTLVFVAFAKP